MAGLDDCVVANKAIQVLDYLREQLPAPMFHSIIFSMGSVYKVKIDKCNSYRITDLKEWILAALNISVGFIKTQEFYESMETKFKGLSTMESI